MAICASFLAVCAAMDDELRDGEPVKPLDLSNRALTHTNLRLLPASLTAEYWRGELQPQVRVL